MNKMFFYSPKTMFLWTSYATLNRVYLKLLRFPETGVSETSNVTQKIFLLTMVLTLYSTSNILGAAFAERILRFCHREVLLAIR